MFASMMVCVLMLVLVHAPIKAVSNKTIYVPDNFPTIQDAINNAAPGSTIVVRDGVYRENIVIDIERNDLTVKSEHGPKNTIIANPSNESESYIIEILGDRIVFEGFKITNDKDVVAYGIKVVSSGTIIKSNIIEGLYINTAIILDNSRGVSIENNTLRETYHGIRIDRSTGCRIANNLIIGMEGNGLYFRHNNDYIVVEGNDISSCLGVGINIESLGSGKIVGNVIIGCQTGIKVGSPMNKIYLNNFVDNKRHVEIQMANTTWNSEPLDYIYDLKKFHGCLGNFWDDYKGVDANHDGVGDTPYKISEAQYDRYPLIELTKSYKIIFSTTSTTTTTPTSTTTPSTTPTTSTTSPPHTASTTPTTSPPITSTTTTTSPPPTGGLDVTIVVVLVIIFMIALIVFLKVRSRR